VFFIIKLLICDVDGTLTDGSIIYNDNSAELKSFSVKDGLILKLMPQLGIPVIFLTGRESSIVKRRAEELGALAIQGIDDKPSVIRNIQSERNLSAVECAYIGDDLNDYAAMMLCGYRACPNDAVREIREICNHVSPFNGGHGAGRDICERILDYEDKYAEFLVVAGLIKQPR